MAKCKNCKNLRREPGLCEWCHCIEDSPDIERDRECKYYKAMTNADRIRNMTDEELAANIMCPNEMGAAEIDCDKSDDCNCYECCLEWLQSEAEMK